MTFCSADLNLVFLTFLFSEPQAGSSLHGYAKAASKERPRTVSGSSDKSDDGKSQRRPGG